MTTEAQTTSAPRRRPALALAVAVLCMVPFTVGILLPYYANGLQDRPTGDSLYLYDLATLWPYDTALGGVVAFVTIVGMPVAPFLAAVVGVWSGFVIWNDRRTISAREVALYSATILVVIASIAWFATPLANELIVWFLD